MPPKPTCKVVKREGEGGARIHPLGCQVRTDVKGDGTKITKNKAGQRKYMEGNSFEEIAARGQDLPHQKCVRDRAHYLASLNKMALRKDAGGRRTKWEWKPEMDAKLSLCDRSQFNSFP